MTGPIRKRAPEFRPKDEDFIRSCEENKYIAHRAVGWLRNRIGESFPKVLRACLWVVSDMDTYFLSHCAENLEIVEHLMPFCLIWHGHFLYSGYFNILAYAPIDKAFLVKQFRYVKCGGGTSSKSQESILLLEEEVLLRDFLLECDDYLSRIVEGIILEDTRLRRRVLSLVLGFSSPRE